MRILAVTDVHGRVGVIKTLKSRVRDYDVLVVAGDLTYFMGKDYARRILRELYDGKPLLFIPGNCDGRDVLEYNGENNIINIHVGYKLYDNILFIGHGGSSKTPFNTPIEFDEDEIWKNLLSIIDNVKNVRYQTLVLVSHAPPLNTKVDMTRAGVHAGSYSVRKFIEKFKPTLCICGHIHEARGVDEINNTVIVNPGPLMYGYYALIDVVPGCKPKVQLLHLSS